MPLFDTLQERRQQQTNQNLPPRQQVWLRGAAEVRVGGGPDQLLHQAFPGPLQQDPRHQAHVPRLKVHEGECLGFCCFFLSTTLVLFVRYRAMLAIIL